MLNATTLLADALGQRLSTVFLRSFGTGGQRIAALLDEAARLVIERLVQRFHGATPITLAP
jgi:hypothetical protein